MHALTCTLIRKVRFPRACQGPLSVLSGLCVLSALKPHIEVCRNRDLVEGLASGCSDADQCTSVFAQRSVIGQHAGRVRKVGWLLHCSVTEAEK